MLRINDPQKHKVLYTSELHDVIINFQFVQDFVFQFKNTRFNLTMQCFFCLQNNQNTVINWKQLQYN